MALDFLALWGVAQAAGFVFRPILEDLATKAAAGFAQDYLKGCIKSVLSEPQKDDIALIVGRSLKEFLQIVQEELEGCGAEETEICLLVNPVQRLLEHRAVQETLRAPLLALDSPASPEVLKNSWNELFLPDLPQELSWTRIANRYGKKANQIRRESEPLRDVLDSQMLEIIAEAINASAPVSPDGDLNRLKSAVIKAYGFLRLEAMDATTFDLNRIRLDHLFIPQHVREFSEFVQQVFELPKELQQPIKLLGMIQGQSIDQKEINRFRKAYLKQPPRSVLELMQSKTSRLIVVLGDPGAGKSSLLQFVVLQWAEEVGADPLEVPFLIELKEYARNRQEGLVKDFLEYLQCGAGVVCRFDQHAIAKRLREGKAALLFDGLDEVFDPEQRKEICADIGRFANDFPGARMVVTSRVIGYKAQTLRDAGFRHFMLQDLNDQQVDEFLRRWHGLAYSTGHDGEAKRILLLGAISESRAIRELAGNPLLLTMMAILNRTQELPRDRAELYTQCSRLLLYQWKADDALRADVRFKGVSLDFKDKQAMLRRVARSMQSSELGLAGNLISQNQLELILEEVLRDLGLQQSKLLARAVIEQLRTRNFILCYVGGDHYAFVHRTFLEYFCASDFQWQFKEERSIDLNYLKSEIFQVHCGDEIWHETLCLISGMLVPKLAADIIDHLLGIPAVGGQFDHLFLAARCFAEIRNKGEVSATGQKLRGLLKSIAATPIPPKIKYQQLTEQDAEHRLVEVKARNELASRIRAARSRAINAVAGTWHDSEILSWLKDIITGFSSEPSVRDAALRQLTDGWKEEGILPFLFELVTIREPELKSRQQRSIFRLSILSHLVRTWPEDPDINALVESLLLGDSDYVIREWALQRVSQVLAKCPTKVEIIHKVIESVEDPRVRRECFRAMVNLDNPDSITLKLAKAELQSDSGAKTKRAALGILVKGSKDDLEIPERVLALALVDKSKRMKRRAKSILQDYWSHLSEVRLFLEADEVSSSVAGN